MTAAAIAGSFLAEVRSAEEWQAYGAMVTAFVAIVAGTIAYGQLSEAGRLRSEQAQPYVAVFLEPVPIFGTGWADLVIRNFGATAAFDVRLEFDSELTAYLGREAGGEALWVPDCLPTLVPGQEWRTLWDSSKSREKARTAGSHVPHRYGVLVRMKASNGNEFPALSFTLDWESMDRRGTAHVLGVHEGSKALRELAKVHKKWSESNVTGGLSVVARSGEARDREVAKQHEQPLWWDRSNWSRRQRARAWLQAKWGAIRTGSSNERA